MLSEDKSEYIQGVHEFNKDNWKKAIELFSKVSETSPYYQKSQNKIKETQEKLEAAKLENLEDCEKLFPRDENYEDYRECLTLLAIKRKDTDICNKMGSVDDISICKANVAVSTNDVSVCEEISGSSSEDVSWQKDTCFAYFAVFNQDKNICYKISDQGYWLKGCLSGAEAKANSPFLGIAFMSVNKVVKIYRDLPVDYGVLVEKSFTSEKPTIVPGGPADKAGVKEGDIILEINGTKINKENYLLKILNSFHVGDEVTLKILRNSKEIELKLILGPQPENK